jgi:putative lipoprotein
MLRRAGFVSSTVIALACVATPAAADDSSDPWIARDKALHFDASAGIAMASYAISTYKLDARWESLAVAGAFTLAVGAGKELLDMTGLGDPSWKDFTWDAVGTVAGLALAWSVDLLMGGVDAAHPALGSPRSVAAPASTSASVPTALVVRF